MRPKRGGNGQGCRFATTVLGGGSQQIEDLPAQGKGLIFRQVRRYARQALIEQCRQGPLDCGDNGCGQA